MVILTSVPHSQKNRLNVWTFHSVVWKLKCCFLSYNFLLPTVIHQVNTLTGRQMLGLTSSLQRDKPGRQLGKSVAVLKMKIWREQKDWSQNEGNLNSLEKRSAILFFCGSFWLHEYAFFCSGCFQSKIFHKQIHSNREPVASTRIVIPE